MPKKPALFDDLQQLIDAHGPPGEEDAVAAAARPMLEKVCDEVTSDEAGNLIGLVKGRDRKKPADRLVVHMDELAMIVKKVRDDGTLRVNPLGGMLPYVFGQGPVEILADDGKLVPGVLSLGSQHATSESYPRYREQDWLKSWEYAFVFTGKSRDDLDAAGVHAGTRVVIAKSRRKLWRTDDHVGGYFLDNRASILICIEAARRLRAAKTKPAADTYIICSTREEIGGHGACIALQNLPGHNCIAVDIGPASREYGVELNADPVVVYADAQGVYDKKLSDALRAAGKRAKIKAQCATLSNFGSDASGATKVASAATGALLCFPAENTHGYEVMHKDAVTRTAQLLAEYLKGAK